MLDLYCTDTAQHLIMAGQDLDDRDRDLPVRRVIRFVEAGASRKHYCVRAFVVPSRRVRGLPVRCAQNGEESSFFIVKTLR